MEAGGGRAVSWRWPVTPAAGIDGGRSCDSNSGGDTDGGRDSWWLPYAPTAMDFDGEHGALKVWEQRLEPGNGWCNSCLAKLMAVGAEVLAFPAGYCNVL
uniref:Uncharacterized protein n=1 Tax=Oryza glumipatula TaxID=40148 RepID=A0A0E0AV35_9ORYZ